MITTEAWVLKRGPDGAGSALDAGGFNKESYSFPDLEDDELLVHWEDIPRLARAAAAGTTQSFFPVYRVNPV